MYRLRTLRTERDDGLRVVMDLDKYALDKYTLDKYTLSGNKNGGGGSEGGRGSEASVLSTISVSDLAVSEVERKSCDTPGRGISGSCGRGSVEGAIEHA